MLRRSRRLTIVAVVLANAVGAAVVTSFALVALPKPDGVGTGTLVANLVAAVAYVLVALVLGVTWGRRRLEGGGRRAWLQEDRAPDPGETAGVLRGPLRITLVQAVLWGLAVVLFTVGNLLESGLLALGVGLTVLLGGVTTSAAAYLLSELALRPVAARAMAAGPVPRRGVPGVAVRWLLAWGLGTGVPVVGLLLVGVVALTPVDISAGTLALTVVALCSIALGFGAIVSVLAAYATVHPIGAIGRGLTRVREGDFGARVAVFESTEIGELQAGFNDMAAGLQERERLRDLFGRQVGEDVARRALEGSVELGGEVREVAVLFVDLVGSTAMAADRPPTEVVEVLNAFFGEVVDAVEGAGGWVNKFEGDAALAIFGAPVGMDDAAGCCLRAARRLTERLASALPDVRAGIGVSFGSVVAGHIGAERRYEYTVIGDPVNEAARLTELAKERDGWVLASGTVVAAAREDERACWTLGEEVALRGRSTPTRLAWPAAAAAGDADADADAERGPGPGGAS